MEKTKKNYSIELLRFVFAISILYFHILSNLIKYTNVQIYTDLLLCCKKCSMFVEGFLIISGFFMFYSITTKKQTIWQFFQDKFVRLYPVFATATLLCYLIGKFSGFDTFMNLIFCYSIGFLPKSPGITWFVAPFFWCLIFYFFLIKNASQRYLNFIIVLIVYFGYVILGNEGFGRDPINGFLSIAMLRVLVSLGLGYLIAILFEKFKNSQFFIEKKFNLVSFVIFSLTEIILLNAIFKYTLLKKIVYNNIIFIPLFAILIFLFVCQKGLISKITNFSFWGKFGQYSYSIYVMQQFSFYLLSDSFWKNSNFLNSHVGLTILYSMLFSIGIGILTFYLVEHPIITRFKSSKTIVVQKTYRKNICLDDV